MEDVKLPAMLSYFIPIEFVMRKSCHCGVIFVVQRTAHPGYKKSGFGAVAFQNIQQKGHSQAVADNNGTRKKLPKLFKNSQPFIQSLVFRSGKFRNNNCVPERFQLLLQPWNPVFFRTAISSVND